MYFPQLLICSQLLNLYITIERTSLVILACESLAHQTRFLLQLDLRVHITYLNSPWHDGINGKQGRVSLGQAGLVRYRGTVSADRLGV